MQKAPAMRSHVTVSTLRDQNPTHRHFYSHSQTCPGNAVAASLPLWWSFGPMLAPLTSSLPPLCRPPPTFWVLLFIALLLISETHKPCYHPATPSPTSQTRLLLKQTPGDQHEGSHVSDLCHLLSWCTVYPFRSGYIRTFWNKRICTEKWKTDEVL